MRKQITKIPPKGFDKCKACEKLILKTIDQQTYNRMQKCQYCQMEFEATEWNFGEIIQGESVEYAFEFTNTGSEPLIITNAKGSCGCTVPVWPREPVAPGESGVVDVKFNSKGKKGKQNKKVTLTTNMVPSQMVLKVTGLVNLKEE
jgi:hypothetical protein